MNEDALSDQIDDLKDEIVNLGVDILDLQTSLNEEKRENADITSSLNQAEEEIQRLTEQLMQIEEKHEEEVTILKNSSWKTQQDLQQRLTFIEENYMKALSICETFYQGNGDVITVSSRGRESIRWAHEAFLAEAQSRIKIPKHAIFT